MTLEFPELETSAIAQHAASEWRETSCGRGIGSAPIQSADPSLE